MSNMSDLGQVILVVVFVLCGLAAALGPVALKVGVGKAGALIACAKTAFLIAAGLCVAALVLLAVAFLTDDFSLAIVSRYSSAELPSLYKLSALWAGAPGSMLLWSVCVFVIFALWLAKNKMDGSTFNAAAVSIGAAVCLAFSALLIFAAEPFATTFKAAVRTGELSRFSMNFWMIVHKPLLFVGYSSFLIPFVVVLAYAFTASSRDFDVYQQGPLHIKTPKHKLGQLRRWLLFGLCFVSLGIAAGARRTYIELGDYRAWGNLENVSLLPWLVAVAALHSRGGMPLADKFRRWTIVLGPLPFILCMFVVIITASGGRKYPLSLDPTGLPLALLVFIVCCVLLWLVCIIRTLKSISITPYQKGPFRLDKAETLSWTNIVLILAVVIIAAATLCSYFSRTLPDLAVRLKPTGTFYTVMFSLVGILLAFLLGMCTLADLHKKDHSSGLPVLFCIAVGMVCFWLVWKSVGKSFLLSLACGVSVLSFVAVLIKMLVDLWAAGKIGRAVAHLGLLILVVVAGFTSAEESITTRMAKEKTINLGGYTITYNSFEQRDFGDITKAGPVIFIAKKGLRKKLWPHNIVYRDGHIVPELAVHTGLLEDLHISFDERMPDDRVMITAKIRPFMFWLWFAAILVVAGSALGLLSVRKTTRRRRHPMPTSDDFF